MRKECRTKREEHKHKEYDLSEACIERGRQCNGKRTIEHAAFTEFQTIANASIAIDNDGNSGIRCPRNGQTFLDSTYTHDQKMLKRPCIGTEPCIVCKVD